MREITLYPNTMRHYDISDKFFILYVIAVYYHKGDISRDKYKGQIQALRKGTLLNYKNTYHSGLNDKWYDHESARSVFNDILDDANDYVLSADLLIETIMFFTGKNYNYAINLFYEYYLRPILDNWYPYSYEEFSKRYGFNFPFEINAVTYSSECYACGSSHSEVDRRRTIEVGEEELLEWLHFQKKGNLDKIPKYFNGLIDHYEGRW